MGGSNFVVKECVEVEVLCFYVFIFCVTGLSP